MAILCNINYKIARQINHSIFPAGSHKTAARFLLSQYKTARIVVRIVVKTK